jgi:hypothetical protein
MERDRASVEARLRDDLEKLHHMGASYDAGKPSWALQMATVLRVILHSTDPPKGKPSHSILRQLGLDGQLKFRDTSLHEHPTNLMYVHLGLVVIGASGDGASYMPRVTAQGDRDNPDLDFNDWWEATVLQDSAGRTWTRKKLVTDLANKEGGAHLDPSQPASIRAIEVENSMGWTFDGGAGGRPFENGPMAPSVRQIAREVELTLQPWADGEPRRWL